MPRRAFLIAMTGMPLSGASLPMPGDGRARLRAGTGDGRSLFGFLQSRPGPLLAAVAERHGCDFIFVDAEHGDFSDEDLEDSLRFAAGAGTMAWLRVRDHDLSAVGRFIAAGAHAILVPHVSTREEAEGLALAMRPHPQTALIAILESGDGARNADRIAIVERVDAVIVGPHDLSADLGAPGRFDDPVFTKALTEIERVARARGKPFGTVPHGNNDVKRLHDRGHRLFILASDDGLLADAAGSCLARARSALR